VSGRGPGAEVRPAQLMIQPQWGNPSGTTQLGMLGLRKKGAPMDPQFGIFTKGSFRPLPMPMTAGGGAYGPSPLNYIAW
jgi:hypothetical protein